MRIIVDIDEPCPGFISGAQNEDGKICLITLNSRACPATMIGEAEVRAIFGEGDQYRVVHQVTLLEAMDSR